MDTEFAKVELIRFPKVVTDERGSFLKIYSSEYFASFSVKEVFYSVTKKGFVRGMHLQVGSSANDRIITCLRGSIFDAVIDARVTSPNYGEISYFELGERDHQAIFVPKGFAHGFQTLSKDSLVMYLSSNTYDEKLDVGINPLFAEILWPLGISGISKRDEKLPTLEQYKENAS